MAWDSLTGGGLGDGYSWLGGYDDISGGGGGGVWDGAVDAIFGGGGGGGGDESWWSSVVDWFGSDSGDGNSWGSNIFGAMLGGLGGAATAYMDEKAVEEQGRQQRKSLEFTAELKDYYEQKDKERKRRALDTYGQFSLMDRWAPKYVNTPPVQVPTKPGP